MANQENLDSVRILNEKFTKANGAIVADYRGLTAMEMGNLRQRLRAESVELHVVKNTLARIAAKGTPIEKVVEALKGPSTIALSYGDVAASAKVMTAFEKEAPNLKVKGGIVEGAFLNAKEVKVIATLPSREQLLANILATMNGPITNFAGVLAGVLRKLVYALKAIEEKKDN